MVKYINKFSLLIAVILFISCKNNTVEPQGSPDAHLSDFEKSMTSTWRYLQIETEDVIYKHADRYSEPGGLGLVSTQGKRTELERRRINYSIDKTYQLLWVDRGNYELGTENDLSKVMLSQQISSVGFQLTLNLRNKALSAYKDIMNMPV